MSKVKVPASIAVEYQKCTTLDERNELLKRYKEWQRGQFAKAHFEYLEREYEKALQEYVSANWLTRFAQRNFIAENKAKLSLLKKLKDTFKCEVI